MSSAVSAVAAGMSRRCRDHASTCTEATLRDRLILPRCAERSGTRVARSELMKDLQTKEPGPHVDNVKNELHGLVEHLRKDAKLIDDPQAAALFETSAE